MQLKKVLYPLFSLFLGAQSMKLLGLAIAHSGEEISVLTAGVFAALLALFVTGVFAFVGFVYPSHRLLPGAYYRIHHPQILSKVSDLLGIRWFRKALLFAFWGRATNRKQFFDGRRDGLDHMVYQTKQSEFGHVGALVAIAVMTIPLLRAELYGIAIILTGINIIGNLYPVLLQRMHRIRIQHIRHVLDRSA